MRSNDLELGGLKSKYRVFIQQDMDLNAIGHVYDIETNLPVYKLIILSNRFSIDSSQLSFGKL